MIFTILLWIAQKMKLAIAVIALLVMVGCAKKPDLRIGTVGMIVDEHKAFIWLDKDSYHGALCEFDNIVSLDDYVTTSQTVAGECHDTGVKAEPWRPWRRP